jgi:hypothetical protein
MKNKKIFEYIRMIKELILGSLLGAISLGCLLINQVTASAIFLIAMFWRFDKI